MLSPVLLVLAACSDNSLSKLNEPPIAQILTPSDLLATSAGATWSLRGSASDVDDATDTLSASWFLNDAEVCPGLAPEADGTTTCTMTAPSGTVIVQLEVRDPDGEVGIDALTLDVGENNAPSAVITSPTEGAVLAAGSTVTLAGTVDDAENAPDALAVSWIDSVDGTIAADPPDTDGNVGGSAVFSTGEHLLTLSVEDTLGAVSEATVSFTVAPPNAPPDAPAVAITPSSPTAGVGLLCAITTPSTDPDGDAVSYRFDWDVDGVAYTSTSTTTEPGDTIPPSVTLEGEVWTCTVTPDDGVDRGPAGSDSVTIGPGSLCPDSNCALRFDGTGDYVEVPDSPTLDGGGRALTVEAWVYYDSVTSNCMTAVRKGTSSSPTYDYWLHKNYSPGDSLYWGSWTSYTAQAFSAVSPGRWYHYAGTYDPGRALAEMWVDGVLVGSSTTYGAPTANSDVLRIGIDWDLGCGMLGVIDEVRISSTVRYTATFSPDVVFTADADTLALWHFDAFTGSLAVDASGNGNDGAIYGATWTTESP